ncbi:MAG: ABC transporter permease subunit [bacterium]|nr:ABC transporter permease subunit [bacterium]
MRPLLRWLTAVGGLLAWTAPVALAQADRVVVGAKNFTESSVLAELMAQVLEAHTDLAVERRLSLGGTMICQEAVRTGEIDLYAEYTGTGWAAVLGNQERVTDPLRTFLHVQSSYRDRFDLVWLAPFGLDNTYALAMTEARAAELGVRRISDLLVHQAKLRAGFSIEFGNRADGYPGLAAAYGLELANVSTLEHGLAYDAIKNGQIDLIDAYSTDGKLARYGLRVLVDDRRFFPPYHAAPVVHGATLRKHPEIRGALERLAFRIDDAEAQRLNYEVEANGRNPKDVAREFLVRAGLLAAADEEPTVVGRAGFFGLVAERWRHLLGLAAWHVFLTALAVLMAAAVAIPLGIAITNRPRLRQLALGAAGVLQTIPSLALLAFLIPVLGLGAGTAVAALFLYAVLPILRNTYTGIAGVDPDLVDAARGMGLRPGQVLLRVQLPLAMRTIMAGLRTATVISIGVATLAAFIGAGGLGEPITEGLYLAYPELVLTGAVPAAILAVLADVGLGRLERRLEPWA